MTENFDAIVIGAGIGGLNCAALLAHEGMKVLVLEQHSKIGGYAHSFKRRNFTFESGIHSVPMSPDGLVMHILKHLGVDSNLECIELPSMYRITSSNTTYTMPSRKDEILDYFKYLNVSSSDISAIIDMSDKFYEGICSPILNNSSDEIMGEISFMSQFHNCSYHNHIESLTSSKALQTLLFGQWPYAGVSARQGSALFSFTMFLLHMREGSHFCKGGFSSLANALSQAILNHGGSVLTKKNVIKLNVENNLVTHVVADDGTEYRASIVISNISPYILHQNLIPQQQRGKRWIRRIGNLKPSASSVIVYLGMNPSFTSLFPDNINFWFDSWDFESMYNNIMTNKKDTIDHLIMLRGIDEGSSPTLTLMNFVKQDYSTNWRSDKMIIAERMIHKLESLYPGIVEMIGHMEVGSPDTLYRYTKNTGGALYGFENVKEMYGEAKLPVVTHIPNLFQTGHWGKPGGGIWNVMFNSFATSKIILKSI